MTMSDIVRPYRYFRAVRSRHGEDDMIDAFEVALSHGAVQSSDREEFLRVYREMEYGALADKAYLDGAPVIERLRPGEH